MWAPIKLNNNNYGIHNGYGLVLRKLSGYSTKREAQNNVIYATSTRVSTELVKHLKIFT